MRPCRIVDFIVLVDHRVKLKENENNDKYLDLTWELKKTVEYESDDCANCNVCFCYCHRWVDKETG